MCDFVADRVRHLFRKGGCRDLTFAIVANEHADGEHTCVRHTPIDSLSQCPLFRDRACPRI